MDYKAAYQPLQVLTASGWQAFDELDNHEDEEDD